jgi:hypothetical protein
MTKAECQRYIWTYKRRRENVRKRLRSLSYKIKIWEKSLRFRKRDEKKRKVVIVNLINIVNEYFGTDIKTRVRNKKCELARNIYYKVGLELKYSGANLGKYVGRSKTMAARGRNQLLTSFKHSPENKNSYHSFKSFFEKQFKN